ncbi:hypothetical protein Sj15T_10000 [Sphingobium sp. TA15]|uniref:Uncharacterized protein n=1 Tax=Sphingobium indicum (strain DSM 16413 / CCM 7287 / MTCC 6362 / UT26 / NBRC 101211 / UT26S) TaxID=452662 RepID=D4Z8S1_SPHIU|nr:hypothetical protein [Sphingobium indicum]BAI99003.1 hypothetical protein SJA_P1-00510 [Sphingobium indicum UT26S]BDD65979.1 hypothetical protein Sj15T_10000 [Sphingobium sp. TA15]
MTQAAPANPSPRLYSQTEHDDRGNFHYQGDLYREREPLPSICKRIERHLPQIFGDAQFSVRRQSSTGSRTIIAELLDAAEDLQDRAARDAFTARVRDQIERFSFTRSNFYQDYISCAFSTDVRIGPAYWAALAARRGNANPVASLIPLTAFKRQLKPGDQLKLVSASAGHPALGATRTVQAVRSGDLIFEGKIYLSFPRASCFACDGKRVRFAIGSEYEPDRHLVYEWLQIGL